MNSVDDDNPIKKPRIEISIFVKLFVNFRLSIATYLQDNTLQANYKAKKSTAVNRSPLH